MQTKKTEAAREPRGSDTGAASGTKKRRFLAPCQKGGVHENNGSRMTPVIPTDYEDNKMKKDSLATLHHYDNN